MTHRVLPPTRVLAVIAPVCAAGFGVAVAAAISFAVTPHKTTTLVGLAALLALCSTTDAFVAWTFTAFPAAAKLAFLLFGPLFDLKLFWLYGLIFKRRFVVALGLALFIVIFFICWRIPPSVFE